MRIPRLAISNQNKLQSVGNFEGKVVPPAWTSSQSTTIQNIVFGIIATILALSGLWFSYQKRRADCDLDRNDNVLPRVKTAGFGLSSLLDEPTGRHGSTMSPLPHTTQQHVMPAGKPTWPMPIVAFPPAAVTRGHGHTASESMWSEKREVERLRRGSPV
ncbi:hypothetical protein B0T25DRAFT_180019 [Lasiosphaeria hispida]|uniref:Uncharacterized protein n=1 Tax=Lasiosphaeria hispida TaxID=260671 RepID=A0AAJ0MDC1_9PEZI|nr:hypothetical protein B0T25DRAFT_180019 [Lasiosphaeria hispida]